MDILTNHKNFLWVAQICHEAISRFKAEFEGETYTPWEELEETTKYSNLEAVFTALRGVTPEGQHNAWWDSKIRDGWTYGPVKSLELKQHPCMVPYSELPELQRAKDKIIIGVVKAISEAVRDL